MRNLDFLGSSLGRDNPGPRHVAGFVRMVLILLIPI